jgi:glycosyltransferase involved in cell wall biosynthesis
LADRLKILWVSHMAPSPPRSGAQARIHGLMTNVAKHHDVTAVVLVEPEFDLDECRRAMSEYCRELVLIPNLNRSSGMGKRLLQLRSLASHRSFDRLRVSVAETQRVIDRLEREQRFDVVNLEFPYLYHLKLRQSPPGTRPPPVVVDTHEIAYDLARQMASTEVGVTRRVYGSVNWRKLRHEERAAFRDADGLCACSAADGERLQKDAPGARVVVIPNAADVDFYQPRPSDPPPDGRTLVYFGLLSTYPNIDAVRFLMQEIWPRVAAARPDARCKIIGGKPSAEMKAHAGPRVEVTGFVDDLRPHLASAAGIAVPLRFGGGTRLKIVEGMAMGRPIVSTRLGAEGIDVTDEKDILLADDADAFAKQLIRLLDDSALGSRLGQAARTLATERYSWAAAAVALNNFFHQVIERRYSRETPTKPGASAQNY